METRHEGITPATNMTPHHLDVHHILVRLSEGSALVAEVMME
jgi:hypothetical protein